MKGLHRFCFMWAMLPACALHAQQWEDAGNLGGGQINALAVCGAITFAATYSGGIFRSADKGVSWTAVNNGLTGTNISALTADGPYLYAVSYTSGVFISADTGTSWAAINNGLPDGAWYNTFAASRSNLCVATVNGHGSWRSVDNGATWAQQTLGSAWMTISCFLFSKTDIFATSSGSINALYRSSDTGATWQALNEGSGFKAMAAGSNSLFAANAGIFRSIDNGESWTPISSDIPQLSFISALKVSGDTLFAGTSGAGVFVSPNSETSWIEVNAGLTDKAITCLAAGGADLFTGTQAGNVFRSSLAGMLKTGATGIPYTRSNSLRASAEQGIVTISYVLPTVRVAHIRIYSTSGKLMYTLLSGMQSAGIHAITIDAKILPAGMQIVRFDAGDIHASETVLAVP